MADTFATLIVAATHYTSTGYISAAFVSLATWACVFSRSDVSQQEPFVARGRLGLKIINPPEDV